MHTCNVDYNLEYCGYSEYQGTVITLVMRREVCTFRRLPRRTRMPAEDYEKGAVIGEGTFGVVTQAKRKQDGATVVLKKPKRQKLTNGVDLPTIREIMLLQARNAFWTRILMPQHTAQRPCRAGAST